MNAVTDEAAIERTPSGYLLRLDEISVVIEARQVRWEHGALYAVVSVRARLAGVRTIVGDVVTEQRVNLSSDRGRKDVAAACADRGPGVDLDWRGFLEDFSVRVLAAEREGKPFETVGRRPHRIDPGFLLAPYLPKGKAAVFYGPGGATKGYLAVAMCVSLATGVQILPGFVPQGIGSPLYLDWESDGWDIDERVKRVARGAGIEAPEIAYRECVVPLVDQIEDVQRQVTNGHHDLLIVDSVGMALNPKREGGDANESVRALYQALRPLGITAILIDHVVGAETKLGTRSSRPYGSVYKENLARNTYEVRPLKPVPGETGVRHITIRHPKANMSDHLPTIGLQVLFAEDAVRFEAEPVQQVPIEEENAGGGPTSTRNLIRAVLEAGHLTEAEIADEIGRKLDSVGRTLRRYSSTASSPDSRWFNRLPSGRWENLPMGLARVSDAG